MTKRTFIVDYSLYGEDVAQAIIELDQEVIDAVDDDWRNSFWDYTRPEQIAAHICGNMVDNRIPLSQMDGWADKDDSMAKILEWPEFYWDLSVKEMK
jgi:hypothetical protein